MSALIRMLTSRNPALRWACLTFWHRPALSRAVCPSAFALSLAVPVFRLCAPLPSADMNGQVLSAIVAVCPPGLGIGKDGTLPWPLLRNEFKHFQRLTMTPTIEGKENVVIMGRKTWFSIPEKNRPLKNRINIVLSKELTVAPEGAHYLSKSLDDALALMETNELKDRVDLVWIIGGSSLYKELLEKPANQRLFITRVLNEFECDTFLPDIDFHSYNLLPEYPGISSDIQEENGVQYRFEVYEKKITESS